MSPIDALRYRRSPTDLPADSSDEELLAWGEALVDDPPPAAAAVAARRSRREPLRASGRIVVDGTSMSTGELLDEIERRAMRSARKPTLVLHRR